MMVISIYAYLDIGKCRTPKGYTYQYILHTLQHTTYSCKEKSNKKGGDEKEMLLGVYITSYEFKLYVSLIFNNIGVRTSIGKHTCKCGIQFLYSYLTPHIMEFRI